MLHYWYFSDWLYRPRTAEELNPSLGGGVTWRQGPHQFDILRTIAGGLGASVRAMTGWDARRPVVGCHAAYLDFEDGVAATAVYSGYDHFNSRELTFGVGAARPAAEPSANAQARRTLRQLDSGAAEAALKQSPAVRWAGACCWGGTKASRGWVLGGPLIVTFDKGDVRLTPGGLRVYSDDDTWAIPINTETDGRRGSSTNCMRRWSMATGCQPTVAGQSDHGSLAGGVSLGTGTPRGLFIAPGTAAARNHCVDSGRQGRGRSEDKAVNLAQLTVATKVLLATGDRAGVVAMHPRHTQCVSVISMPWASRNWWAQKPGSRRTRSSPSTWAHMRKDGHSAAHDNYPASLVGWVIACLA